MNVYSGSHKEVEAYSQKKNSEEKEEGDRKKKGIGGVVKTKSNRI